MPTPTPIDCKSTFDARCCDAPERGISRGETVLLCERLLEPGGAYTAMAQFVSSWKGLAFPACFTKAAPQCFRTEIGSHFDECCRAAHNLCASCPA